MSITLDTTEVAKQLPMDSRSEDYSGGDALGKHPYIPNTMVKTQTADDTILETVWESRVAARLNKTILIYQMGCSSVGEHLPCKQGSRVRIFHLHSLENPV